MSNRTQWRAQDLTLGWARTLSLGESLKVKSLHVSGPISIKMMIEMKMSQRIFFWILSVVGMTKNHRSAAFKGGCAPPPGSASGTDHKPSCMLTS